MQLCGATGAKESQKDGPSKCLSETLDFAASEAKNRKIDSGIGHLHVPYSRKLSREKTFADW